MCFFETIVPVHGCPGFFLFLLNIFFPGIGTILMSCMGRNGIVCTQLLIGIVQLILAPLLIGWVWSIWWGCLIWGKEQKGAPYYHKG